MKHAKTLLHCALVLGALATGSLTAAPLGTAFTYQGRLEQNGAPAPNGIYQMNFALFADAIGGGPSASNNVPAVPVTNGLFNTMLDFGATAFTGEERWLQITVRTNNNGLPFVLLSPRTRLAPTPNAVYASTAGTVTNGAIQVSHLGTMGTPTPGQVLGFNSGSLVWQAPGGGGTWSLNSANAAAFYNNGRVGIGTNQPSGALHVASGGVAVTGSSSPFTDAGRGLFLESSGIGGGLFAYDYGTGSPKNLLLNSPGGNVGIRTINPRYTLDVNGEIGWGASLLSQNQSGAIELGDSLGNGNSPFLDFHYGIGASQDFNVRLINDGDNRLSMYGHLNLVYGDINMAGQRSINSSGRLHIQANEDLYLNPFAGAGTVYVGGGGASPTLHVVGSASVCSLTIRGGCDLAEPFPMKEEQIDKGSVVVIDEEHPGRLKLSTRAYDTQVAGIVSGANGINPGIALKQEGVLDSGHNVALSGRVYVKADASHGAIKPGDLLTTSNTPGHAMKVTDQTKSQGAILGKAMSALKEGTGLVLVLVTLQ